MEFYQQLQQNFKINKFFKLDDYKELNKDIIQNKFCKSNSDYINHYKNKGKNEGRLINKEQLKVCNEFGNEIILYIPYYYYLYTNGLLFDNVIESYKGMEPYYCWINPKNVIFTERKREWRKYFLLNISPNWHQYPYNPLVYNDNDHVNEFNKKYVNYFDYRNYYKKFLNNNFNYDILELVNKYFINKNKPNLIICNKITKEWGLHPINYYTKQNIKLLLEYLTPKFNIIYSCNQNNMKINNYSYDDNELNQGYTDDMNLDFLEEQQYINTELKSNVVIFEDLVQLFKLDYNTSKLNLFSNCEDYISVQGGNSYLISYFFKNLFILHKYGNEYQPDMNINTYQNWYKEINSIEDKSVIVENNFENLFDKIKSFYNIVRI
jgi:hypothetical protein